MNEYGLVGYVAMWIEVYGWMGGLVTSVPSIIGEREYEDREWII